MSREEGHNIPLDTKDVFFFVNPTSGGNLASAYTNLGKECIEYDLPEVGAVALRIYNIKDGAPGDKKGFKLLKERLNELRGTKTQKPLANVQVGGGDGTVMWVCIELHAHGINTDEVAIGIVPFGTGNDHSRTLGWGGNPPTTLIGKDQAALKKAIQTWLTAEVVPYDLWHVETETHEGGGFQFIDGKEKALTEGMKKQHNITMLDNGGMKMVKPLCNYYSIGYDPRGGLGFDKNRTKSATLNLGVYFIEGFKKAFFSKPPTIHDVLNDIQVVYPDGESKTIVTTDKSRKETDRSFVGKPIELAFLNIPSFSKGTNFWANCSNSAVKGPGGKKLDPEVKKALCAQKQVVGDAQLTCMTYNSAVSFSMDVTKSQMGCHGCIGSGKRVFQTGNGVTTLQFHEKENLKTKKEGRVYAEIDGEFFIMNYPKSVTLKHFKKINVLKNRTPITQGCCIPPKHFAVGDETPKEAAAEPRATNPPAVDPVVEPVGDEPPAVEETEVAQTETEEPSERI